MSDALQQWVADQTGLTAIWANPNAPRPNRPYASLQIINVARLGNPSYGAVNEQGESEADLQREFTLSVSVYESTDNADPRSGLNRAQELRDSLDLQTVLMTLAEDGWAFRGVELLADTTQALEGEWEPRATFDVRFGTTVTRIDDLGFVEKVFYTGEIDDRNVEFNAELPSNEV